MHQTKKGGQWYFGMKAPIGVDSQSRLIHSVVATAENVHDSQVLAQLLHGNEHAYTATQLTLVKAMPSAKKRRRRKILPNPERLEIAF